MGKITKEQLANAVYRASTLKSKLAELESVINGESTPFLPLIDGEDGKTSAPKLEALIKELIECFKRAREITGTEIKDYEEEMYSDFLYCAMQITRNRENNLYPNHGLLEPTNTFGDIIEIAEKEVGTNETYIHSYRDFLKELYFRYRGDRNQIDFLSFGVPMEKHKNDRPYRISKFCEHMLRDISDKYEVRYCNNLAKMRIPTETHIELCKEYAYKHKLTEEQNAYYMDVAKNSEKIFGEEIQAKIDYYAQDYDPDMEAFYDDFYAEENKMREDIMNELRKEGRKDAYPDNELLRDLSPYEIDDFWDTIEFIDHYNAEKFCKEHIADKDTLHERFLRFLELYYDNDHSSFAADVGLTVTVYLIENGHTVLPFDEQYGLVMYLTEQSAKRITLEVERVKNK